MKYLEFESNLRITKSNTSIPDPLFNFEPDMEYFRKKLNRARYVPSFDPVRSTIWIDPARSTVWQDVAIQVFKNSKIVF